MLNHRGGHAFIYVIVESARRSLDANPVAGVVVPMPALDVPDLNSVDASGGRGEWRGTLSGPGAPIHMSIHMSIHVSIHMSITMSVHMSTHRCAWERSALGDGAAHDAAGCAAG